MEISCMQNASMKSQCKHKVKNDCDDRMATPTITHAQNICRRRKTFQRINYDITMTLTIITIALLYLSPASAARCPAQCSCTGDTTAFCNNNKYTTFPNSIPSTVQKLYLFNNNISRISTEALRPLTNLTLLDISGNKISNHALWGGVFNKLSNLENLMLQENQIVKITVDMFKGLNKLARIYLHDNQISFIEPGSFSNLPNLIELKLRNNRLVSFPKFENTSKLLLLDLSYNKLRTIRDMAMSTVNVEQLLLQGNQLTQLRTSLFDDTSKLRHLDISNNRLTAVPQVIKSLTSLRYLNMSLNKINVISGDTFRNLVRLKTLDLHGMALTSLPYGIIPPRIILNVLDISGNEWNCRCGVSWLPQYITIFEEAFIDSNDVRCASTSKLRNRRIKDLKVDDFECTEAELAQTLMPPIEPVKPTTTKPKPRPSKPAVNPCDVYICFNGGTCMIEKNYPRCECTKDWTGQLCKTSLTTSTTTTTTTTISTTRKPSSGSKTPPPLLVNSDSITETSVEIILPQTNTELLVSVSEVGNKDKIKEMRITPRVHPFTVWGLESGKVYNICIHSPLVSGRPMLSPFINNKDSLCAKVKTEGDIRVMTSPIDTDKGIKIEIPPAKEEFPTQNVNIKDIDRPVKPGDGDKLQGGPSQAVTTSTENDDFQILYPVLGAGLGAVIIVVMLVMFFICYRQKRRMKLKKESEDGLYIAGAPIDPNQPGLTDIELGTIVHHHHHNHYNATNNGPKGVKKTTKKSNTVESKPATQQSSFINNNGNPRRVSTPNKTSSLGRSSNSSSSNCGTLQTRYGESPQQYGPPPPQPLPPQHQYIPVGHRPQYETIPPNLTMNGRANEYVYRNHQNNNNSAPIPNHCRVYEPEMMDERQPLMGMNQFHFGGEGQMYPVIPINGPQYIPPSGGLSYPQSNNRSAFQPIQSPRKNTVRTPTSESGPITTHVNTAHVLPTSSCMGNIVNENIPMYREGVPVA